MNDVAALIESLGKGEPDAAEKLLPVVYDELRKLAPYKMAGEPAAKRYNRRRSYMKCG